MHHLPPMGTTVSEDAGIEPRAVAKFITAARRSRLDLILGYIFSITSQGKVEEQPLIELPGLVNNCNLHQLSKLQPTWVTARQATVYRSDRLEGPAEHMIDTVRKL